MREILFLVVAMLIVTTSAFAQPGNDDCSGAFNISDLSGGCNNYTMEDAQVEFLGTCTNGSSGDVYFAFTAQGDQVTISVQNADGGMDIDGNPLDFNPEISVVVACGGGAVEIACINSTGPFASPVGNELTVENLVCGDLYYINIVTSSSEALTFDLCVTNEPEEANSDICNALPISQNTSCGAVTPGTVLNSCPGNQFACAGANNTGDAYFSFVANSHNPTISVQGDSDFDAIVQLLSADCSSPAAIGNCVNDSGPGGLEEFIPATELECGTTYIIAVSNFNGDPNTPTFTVDVCDSPEGGCTQSYCGCNVTPTSISLGCESGCNNNAPNGGSVGTTISTGLTCFDNFSINPTTIYEYTSSGATTIFSINSDFQDPSIAIFNADCSSLLQVDDSYCGFGNGGFLELSICDFPAGTYYIAVADLFGNEGNFELCISEGTQSAGNCNSSPLCQSLVDASGGAVASEITPNTVVEFCITVEEFIVGGGCQWLHGVVPILGPCYDISTFTPISVTQPGNSADLDIWFWYEEGQVDYNVPSALWGTYTNSAGNLEICNVNENPNCVAFTGGDLLPAGWYVHNPTSSAGGPTGPGPDDTWGDGPTGVCGETMSGWEFCFSVEAHSFGVCNDPSFENDCSIAWKTLTDGEIGGYTSIPPPDCLGDPIYDGGGPILNCCETPDFASAVSNAYACEGGISGVIEIVGGPPNTNYSWIDPVTGLNINLSADAFGDAALGINLPLGTTGSFSIDITGRVAGCPQTESIEIPIVSNVMIDEITPPCVDGQNTDVTVFASGGSGNYFYAWSHDPSETSSTIDIDGLTNSSYTVTVTDGDAANPGCGSDVRTYIVQSCCFAFAGSYSGDAVLQTICPAGAFTISNNPGSETLEDPNTGQPYTLEYLLINQADGIAYAWSDNGDFDLSFEPAPCGNYIVYGYNYTSGGVNEPYTAQEIFENQYVEGIDYVCDASDFNQYCCDLRPFAEITIETPIFCPADIYLACEDDYQLYCDFYLPSLTYDADGFFDYCPNLIITPSDSYDDGNLNPTTYTKEWMYPNFCNIDCTQNIEVFDLEENVDLTSDEINANPPTCNGDGSVTFTFTIVGPTNGSFNYFNSVMGISGLGNYNESVDVTVPEGYNPNDCLAITDYTFELLTGDQSACFAGLCFPQVSCFECEMTASAAVTTPVSCPGECDAEVTISIFDGMNDYSFDWDDDTFDQTGVTTDVTTTTGVCPGTYEITITDANNCEQIVMNFVVDDAMQPVEPSPIECWETNTFDDASCMWITTGTQDPEPMTECWETATFNNTSCEWEVSGTQDPEPTTECYETATFNNTSCTWDITGTQDPEPTTECYETATFNNTSCTWDVTGTQDPEPTTECYETATFNNTSCTWEVTGTQDPEPTTECYETATYNSTTCTWEISGTQDPEPTTACYETATFNNTSCSWDVTGTQDPEPTTACYETATFNNTSCSWDVTGTQDPEPTTECYETATFNNTSCTWDVTGMQDPEPTTECYETATFNNTSCTWDVTGTQDPEPTTECYETATFNNTSCTWDVTGIQDPEPTTECYETATFNNTSCMWDVTGTQDPEPTTECYETATYNSTTCMWDVTGTQDPEPTTECYETATFNSTSCTWEITGSQDPEPTTECYETTTFNNTSCTWEVSGTQDPEPTTECYETAIFNNTSCTWEVTGTQDPEPTTECYETATFNNTSCMWDVTGTQDPEPTTECYETATYNSTTCMWDVTGTQDPEPTTECWETATFNNTSCTWEITGTQDPEPTTECYETATFNNTSCMWDVTGTQDPAPTTECWETATFNNTSCTWEVTGTQDPEPSPIECWQTNNFDNTTCMWVTSGTQPNCDDNCQYTDDSYDPTTCDCINISNPPVCDDNDCTTIDSYDPNSCMCNFVADPTYPLNCDDSDCSTIDVFNPTTCLCENTPDPTISTMCDDNDCNTTDNYNPNTCLCEYTQIPPPSCDDMDCTTTDSYDSNNCQCVNEPIAQTPCDDNNPCTADDMELIGQDGLNCIPCAGTPTNPTTPIFSIIDTYCINETANALPTTSDNGIDGTWLPPTIGTTSAGPANYIFTPDDDECATNFTLPITINDIPSLIAATGVCDDDLMNYTAIITSDGMITSDVGTVTNNNDGTFTISDVMVGVIINVTATSTANCVATTTVDSPDCDCGDIEEPIGTGGNYCENENIPELSVTVTGNLEVNWFDAAGCTGTPIAANTLNFTPSAAGTFYAQATNPADNCTSDCVPIVLTEFPLPTVSIGSEECDEDLLNWCVDITSNGTITTNIGTVTENNGVWSICDIPVGTEVIYTATSANNCTVVDAISSPICSCGTIADPVPTNNNYCIGATIPALTATVATGLELNWYDAAGCNGTPVATNTTTYTPTAPGTFYLQAVNPADNCTSGCVEIILFENPLPSLTTDTPLCDADLLNYSVVVTSDGVVTSDFGIVVNNNDGTYSVTGIPIASSVVVTATSVDNCISMLNIDPPPCTCDDIDEPVGDNVIYCEGETIPDLIVSITGNLQVNWYSDGGCNAGGILASNTTSFSPTGPGSYFAQAVNPIDDCTSDCVEFIVTENSNPTLTFDTPECDSDLLSYFVVINSDGNVTANVGTVVDNMNGTFTISDVDIASSIIVTSTSMENCISMITVDPPTCDCNDIDEPVGDNVFYCAGETIPDIVVSVTGNLQVNWYSDGGCSTGGLLESNTLSYSPTGPGSYFAQAMDPIDGCTSDCVEFIVTENPLPTLTNDMPECSSDLTSWSVVIYSNGTIIADNGTAIDNNDGSFTMVGCPLDIAETITATSAEGCITTITIAAPPCTCDDIDEPAGPNVVYCQGDDIPDLEVSITGNLQVNWYSDGGCSSGSLLEANTTTYDAQAPGSYFAQGVDPIDGCTSDCVEFIVTENPLPTLTNDAPECDVNLTEYSVVVNSDGTVTADVGSVVDNMNGTFTISGVAEGTDINVTSTSTEMCVSTLFIPSADCDCTTVVPDPIPTNESYCVGEVAPDLTATAEAGLVINWYDDAACGGTVLSTGTTFPTTGLGIFYVQAVNPVDGCTSNCVEVTLTENIGPAISNDAPQCDMNLTTYNVVVISDGTVTADVGTVVDNMDGTFTISGVAEGTDINVTSTSSEMCVSTLFIPSADCDCTTVVADPIPTNGVYCTGETVPDLTVTAEAGLDINWYNDAACGSNVIATGTSFAAPMPGTYYVQTVNPVDGCTSNCVEITLTENALPTLTNDAPQCDMNLTTYNVVVISDGIVTADVGTVVDNMNGTFTISGVAEGTDINVTSTSSEMCVSTLFIPSADCDCTTVVADPIPTNGVYCTGETVPDLTVTAEAGLDINWYNDAACGGNVIETGTSFAAPMPGTYYVQAVNPVDGCTSNCVEITLTENALPTLSNDAPQCDLNLTTYNVVVISDGIVTADVGTVVDNMNGTFTISGVAEGTDINVTSTSSEMCVSTLFIPSADCDCTTVVADPIPTNGVYCTGETVPDLTVTAEAGLDINWYNDAACGGNVIETGTSFAAPMPGTYYVQAVNPVDGCTSNCIEITLTENALPTLSQAVGICDLSLTTYSVVITSDGMISSDIGTLTDNMDGTYTISDVAIANSIMVTATSTEMCVATTTVDPPNCSCGDLDEPIPTNNAYCFGEVIPALTATVTAGLEINWYGDGACATTALATNTDSFTPMSAGTYYVQAVNPIDGCTSDCVPVTLTENPELGFTQGTSDCSPDNSVYDLMITITGGTAPYLIAGPSNSFDNGGGIFTIEDIADNTTVTFTVTDAENCTSMFTTAAIDCNCVNPSAPVNVTFANYCAGDTPPVLSVDDPGNEDLVVTWYDGAGDVVGTGVTFQTTGPDDFTVNIVDAVTGCFSASMPAPVIEVAIPIALIIQDSAYLDCEFQTFTIDATGSSPSVDVEYDWSGPDPDVQYPNAPTITVDQSGTYILNLIEQINGCIGTDEILIIDNEGYPLIDVGTVAQLDCNTDMVTLNGSNSQTGATIDYNWLAPNGEILPGTIVEVSQVGTYTLVGTDSFNSCENSETIEVIGNYVEPIVNAGEDQTLDCAGSFVAIGDNNSSTSIVYSWASEVSGTLPLNSSIIQVNEPGSYTLTATDDSNGCSAADLVSVFPNNTNIDITEFEAEDPDCFGEENGYFALGSIVGGTEPYVYSIENGPYVTGNQFFNLAAGSYDLLIQDAMGCEMDTTIVINTPTELVLQLPQDTTIQLGDSINITALINQNFDSINWVTTVPLECDTCQQSWAYPLESGAITVTVYDENGCVDTDLINIFVNRERMVYVPSAFSPNGDGLNDFAGIFAGIGIEKINSFRIFDRWGEQVYNAENFQPNDPAIGWDGNFNGKKLNPAVFVYVAEIEFSDGEVEIFYGDIALMR